MCDHFWRILKPWKIIYEQTFFTDYFFFSNDINSIIIYLLWKQRQYKIPNTHLNEMILKGLAATRKIKKT